MSTEYRLTNMAEAMLTAATRKGANPRGVRRLLRVVDRQPHSAGYVKELDNFRLSFRTAQKLRAARVL